MSNSTFDTAVLALSPIRYYPLSEASGAVINDLGSQAQNGAVNGVVSLGQPGIVPGDSNTSATFPSGAGSISIPTTGLPSGASPWTAMCVVEFASIPSAGNYPIALDIGTYRAASGEISLYFNGDDGQFECGIFGVGNITPGTYPQANKPYLLAATYDGAYVRFYVNGVRAGNINQAAALNLVYGPATIGNVSVLGLPFSGSEQAVAFWNSALSQSQIDSLVQAMVSPVPAKSLPVDGYGIYELINPNVGQSVWGPRLQQIAAAGIKLVMNYSLLLGSTANMIAYINYAYSLGLRVIVDLKEPWIWLTPAIAANAPTMYAESGNQATDSGFTTYVVNQVKNLPGTWGYYVGDEPGAGNHAALALHSGYIHTADAVKPRLIIENWTVFGDAFYTGQSPMWDICEIFGDDYYPLGAAGNQPNTYVVANGIQSYATAKARQSAIVLQAVTNGGAWPLSSDIAAWLADTLTFMQPRLVLFYSYFDIQNSADPTTHWNNLVQALQTIQPLHYVSATWVTRDMQATWKTRG